jgi:hypothetical protein
MVQKICLSLQCQKKIIIKKNKDMANYFVCSTTAMSKKSFKTLYKVIKTGSCYANTSRTIVQEMVKGEDGNWALKPNGTPLPLVYGKLKGFASQVTDDEILACIDKNLTTAEKERDFAELRAYFNRDNASEVETWHKAGATVMSNQVWCPYSEIPTDLV